MKNDKTYFGVPLEVMGKLYVVSAAVRHANEAYHIAMEAKIAIMNCNTTSHSDAFQPTLDAIDDALALIEKLTPVLTRAVAFIPTLNAHAQDVCPCPDCWRARSGMGPERLRGHHVVFDSSIPEPRKP